MGRRLFRCFVVVLVICLLDCAVWVWRDCCVLLLAMGLFVIVSVGWVWVLVWFGLGWCLWFVVLSLFCLDYCIVLGFVYCGFLVGALVIDYWL